MLRPNSLNFSYFNTNIFLLHLADNGRQIGCRGFDTEMSELDLSKGSVDISASELGMDTDEAGKDLGEQGGQKIADEAMNNPQAGHEGIKGGWIDPATVDSIEPVLDDDDNHSRSEHECNFCYR
jgi:hypothetical protein